MRITSVKLRRRTNNFCTALVSLTLLYACGERAAESDARASGATAATIVPGQAIVQFRPGTSAARVEAVLEATGTRVVQRLSIPRTYVLGFSSDVPVDEMVERFQNYPEVQYVEPNRVIRLEPPGVPPPKPGPEKN